MKYNNRKLEIEKNLKYTMTLITQLYNTQDIKELRPAVEVV